MTERHLLSTLWLIGMLVAGSEPLAAPAGPALTPTATWLEVSERTACEAMQDEYCVGRYGFAIRRGGTLVAGGSGGSRTIEGKLTLLNATVPLRSREVTATLSLCGHCCSQLCQEPQ